jgi:hypothetical protein
MKDQGKPALVVRQGSSKVKERENKRERKERKEKEAKRKERKERENKRERNLKISKEILRTNWGNPQFVETKKPELIKRLTPKQRKSKASIKEKHYLAAPKKPAHVPSTLRPYIDLWRKYGGSKHLDEYTKTFKNGVRLLKRLLKGVAFDKSSFKDEWEGHLFTYDDFELSLKRLHLAITSEYYYPLNKRSIKSTTLADFILHGYGRNGDASLFLLYLKDPPRRIFPDKDPKLTKLLIVASRSKFVKASNRLSDFFDSHKQNISPGFIIDRPRMVRWLFEAVQVTLNGFEDDSIKPGHLCSDLTFNERLPKFLIRHAVFRDRHVQL